MIKTKDYENYEEYVKHQKSKADHGSPLYQKLLTDLWEPDCEGFRENFRPYASIIEKCSEALCLGARTGQEVHVLKKMGLNAIGIDLVSTPPLVIEGDVHNLQFPGNSFDFIFSNIFDHVLYPERFIAEIKRVLKPGGYCLLHLSIATESHDHPDDDAWAANSLTSSKAVIELFGKDYEVLEDHILGQKNWPSYWTLFIRQKNSE